MLAIVLGSSAGGGSVKDEVSITETVLESSLDTYLLLLLRLYSMAIGLWLTSISSITELVQTFSIFIIVSDGITRTVTSMNLQIVRFMDNCILFVLALILNPRQTIRLQKVVNHFIILKEVMLKRLS